MRLRRIVLPLALALAVGCGDDTDDKKSVNNGGANNGGSNNGTANNGGSNNGTANNGGTNNGTANNGGTNNGTANNGGTNNGTANNGGTNNGTANNGTNNGTGNNGTNNGTGGDISEVEQALWDAICEATFQCPNRNTVQLVAFFGSRFTDEADCKASQYRGDITSDTDQLVAAVAGGRLSYDASKLVGCTDAFKQFYCDVNADPDTLFAACEGIYTPLVDTNGSCALDDECISDNCVFDGPNTQCFGTCTPQRAECGAVNCADDQFCDVDTCVARKAAGETCEGDDECVSGTGCLVEGANQMGTCTMWNTIAEGGECGGDSGFCANGNGCIGQQVETCQPVVFNTTGGACNFGDATCQPGLACQDMDFTGGICGPPRGMGEDCQFFFQCTNDLYCDGFDFAMPQNPGSCLPRKAAGMQCSDGTECATERCAFANDADEFGLCEARTVCRVP